jgi:hypothetical protein
MKHSVLPILAIATLISGIGRAQPHNVDIGAPTKSGELILLNCSSGDTSHLLIVTRTPGPRVGAYRSTNGGQSWDGVDTVPGNGSNDNDPYAAFDSHNHIAYASFGFNRLSHSTNWGATWSTPITLDSATSEDAPVITVDNSNGSHQGRVYYAGKAHLFVSDNSGTTFHSTGASPSYGVFPCATVDGRGIVHYFARGTVTELVGSYSTNGGASWHSYQGASFSAYVNFNKHRPISAASDGDLVAVAYENSGYDDYGNSSNIHVMYSVDTGANWHTGHILTATGMMPTVTLNKGKMFVAYYEPIPSNAHTYNLVLAVSADSGKSWTKSTVSSQSFHSASISGYGDSLLSQYGAGDYFGICVLDSSHIGIAWADNRNDTNHRLATTVWLANAPLGTLFRNEHDGVFADSLTFYPQSDTTQKTTLVSQDNRILTDGATYVAHPDSMQHYRIGGIDSNTYKFYQWNALTNALSFNHTFTATGVKPETEEANFKRVDSLTVRNDLEGGDGGVIQVRDDAVVSGAFDTVASKYAIDSAFRSPVTTYGFRAFDAFDTSKHLYRSYWWFEKWDKKADTSRTWTSNQIWNNSTFSANFKGHLRSADTLGALDFNNGRKSCWSKPDQRHFLVYESRGNIYWDSSTSSSFCDFVKEKKLNTTYGNAHHPAIAFLDRPDSTDSLHKPFKTILVTWDEVTKTADSLHYRVMLCVRNAAGNWLTPTAVDSFVVDITSVDPPAPSICAAQANGLGGGYTLQNIIHGAVAWHRGSTVWVAAITNTNGVAAKRIIDTAFHGSYVTIEPGYWAIDRAPDSSNHTVDFHVAFHDTSKGNNGYDGGLRYRYLTFGYPAGWSTPYLTDQIMNNYWEITPTDPWGMPQHPSLCIGAEKAHPIIVAYILDEKSTYLAMPYQSNFASIKRRSGMYTRIKDSVNGTWGLFRIIAKYNDTPLLYAPSVTCFPNDSGKYMVAWFKHIRDTVTGDRDSIQFGKWAYTDPVAGKSGRDYDASMNKGFVSDFARTPHLEYGQKTSTADSSILCNHPYHYPDTILPRVMRRANNASCEIADNRITSPIHDWHELRAYSGTAYAGFSVGEFTFIDSTGSETEVPLMRDMMVSPAATPNEIRNVNGTVYFTLPNNAKYLIGFHAPSVNDSSDLGEFTGTKSITFTSMLMDSATNTPIMTIGTMQRFQGGAAITTCMFDTARVGALAQMHKTLYVRTQIDTGSGFSNLHFSCAHVISEDKLSAILADGSGLGKQSQSGGRFGDVVMPQNPIDLTIYPNPAMMGSRPTVQYTIPVEDADDVAEVRVWDIAGADVSTLVHDIKSAGRHEVTFDGTKLPTGRYIVAVHLRTHQQSKMVNLVR